MITELSVPGVNLEVLKCPHDLSLRLLVQDLFLVDRIQTFGPEYELVVCSSGKSLLSPSPTPSLSSVTSPRTSCATPTPSSPLMMPCSVSSSRLSSPAVRTRFEASELLSGFSGGGALLTLSYEMLKPWSPHHPSVREAVDGGGRTEGAGGEQGREDVEEPVIHRVNIQCTAVDAIGTLLYVWVCVE